MQVSEFWWMFGAVGAVLLVVEESWQWLTFWPHEIER